MLLLRFLGSKSRESDEVKQDLKYRRMQSREQQSVEYALDFDSFLIGCGVCDSCVTHIDISKAGRLMTDGFCALSNCQMTTEILGQIAHLIGRHF